MQKKIAVSCSGGGANGAYQAQVLKDIKAMGIRPVIWSGNSVGAFSATMGACDAIDRYYEVWEKLTSEQLHTSRLGFKSGAKVVMNLKRGQPNGGVEEAFEKAGFVSMYDTAPLEALINREVDLTRIAPDIDLRIGAVSLKTRQYHVFRPSHPNFKRAILASSAIPGLYPNVDISPEFEAMADGSIRNHTPIGDIMDAEPDEIIIIGCRPRTLTPFKDSPKNAARAVLRAIDMLTHQIFLNDLREFERKNKIALQTQAVIEEFMALGKDVPEQLVLKNKHGKPYRYVKPYIVEPTEDLGEMNDYSPGHAKRCFEMAAADVKRVFANYTVS